MYHIMIGIYNRNLRWHLRWYDKIADTAHLMFPKASLDITEKLALSPTTAADNPVSSPILNIQW